MLGYRLTGAALNPARWFGTVLWEAAQPHRPATPGAFADMFVYVFGPVVGALLGGLVYFKVLQPAAQQSADAKK